MIVCPFKQTTSFISIVIQSIVVVDIVNVLSVNDVCVTFVIDNNFTIIHFEYVNNCKLSI